VSNDASRSRDTFARQLAARGLAVPAERFVTAGTLLPDYFRDRGLAGARTIVLGTEDSCAYVREGGGTVIELAPGVEIDALAVCDDAGTPFLEGMEIGLSAIVRALRAGRRPTLVCPNPDLVYPKRAGEVGFTAGAMAAMIATALERMVPGSGLAFDFLGKPNPHLMRAAAARIGVAPERLVMIGDQLETDVAGAHAAGIASALVNGISHWDARQSIAPHYLLGTIAP
jgi:ribonucleotide monophosphatase NagD (HAD superfamily)